MKVKGIFSLIPKNVSFCTRNEPIMDDFDQPKISNDLSIYLAMFELENLKFERS